MVQNLNMQNFRRQNALANFHAASGTTSAEVTANALHAANDVVGGRLYLEGAGGYNGNGILMSLSLTDYGAVGGQVDVFIYKAEPTSIAGNAAFAESEADGLNRVAIVSIASADWLVIDAGAKVVYKELSVPFIGESLWAYIVARGTPTYSSDKIVALVNTFHE